MNSTNPTHQKTTDSTKIWRGVGEVSMLKEHEAVTLRGYDDGEQDHEILKGFGAVCRPGVVFISPQLIYNVVLGR